MVCSFDKPVHCSQNPSGLDAFKTQAYSSRVPKYLIYLEIKVARANSCPLVQWESYKL